MLPVERRHRIKSLIRDRKHIKISELSEQLGVSEMTIHRDLKPLINEGFAEKTFGGVTLNQQEVHVNGTDTCVICQHEINERLAYRLILQDNNIEMACCAHCGLIRHQQLADQVVQAICHDFLKSTTISVANASYVMDTSIDIGCCQPQVLTFEQKDHAEKFVRGFGGNVYCFKEAMYLINEKNERVSSQTLVPIL